MESSVLRCDGRHRLCEALFAHKVCQIFKPGPCQDLGKDNKPRPKFKPAGTSAFCPEPVKGSKGAIHMRWQATFPRALFTHLVLLPVAVLFLAVLPSGPVRQREIDSSNGASAQYSERLEDTLRPGHHRSGQESESEREAYAKHLWEEYARWQARRRDPQPVADIGTWVSLGPTNGAGKMGALAVHPTAPGTLYAGADGGGIWKTTDGGTSWGPVSDGIAILAISALALAPSSPNVLYAGTGSQTIPGIGMLKSTDGGVTWSMVGSPVFNILRISVHPNNPQELVFAGGEVSRSTDGGVSWTKAINVASEDLARDPSNPQILYTLGASFDVQKSTDGGVTWQEKRSGLPTTPTQFILSQHLATSPSSPQVLYLSAQVRDQATGADHCQMFKTVDGAESWVELLSVANNPDAAISHFLTQGTRNSAIVVSPTDPNVVIAGGLNYIKSSDGGVSWKVLPFRNTTMHVDAVDLQYQGSTLYIANDGGIWSSPDDGETAASHNLSLVSRQHYTLAIDPVDQNRMLSGSQDNGVDLRPDSGSPQWTSLATGDGFDCVIDPDNPAVAYYLAGIYSSGNPIRYFRTKTAGSPDTSWQEITPQFPGGEFGHGLALDTNRSTTVYTSSYRLWKSTDEGDSWSPLPTTTSDGSSWDTSGSFVEFVTLAPSDSSIVMVTHLRSGIFRSTDGGMTWTNSVLNNPPFIGKLEIDPQNPQVVYAAYNEPFTTNRLFMSTDGGRTWAPRSQGLPEFDVQAIRVDPTDSNTLYCGTDVGVYQSTDQGASWQRLGAGLPNVQVNALEIFDDGSRLRAATYGRGVWEISLRPPSIPQPRITSAATSGKKLLVYGKHFDDGAVILINGGRQKTRNDGDSPRGLLVAKKAGRVVQPGDHLQVRNSTGVVSSEFLFTP